MVTHSHRILTHKSFATKTPSLLSEDKIAERVKETEKAQRVVLLIRRKGRSQSSPAYF